MALGLPSILTHAFSVRCVINDTCTPDIEAPPISVSQVRFGAGSDFGFMNPSRFFDLPASSPESPATGFGIRSVSVGNGKGHRKSSYVSSTNRHINKGDGGLIIPWSKVRVLPCPPLPIEIIALWH
jgi:hypothetical protein